MANISLLKRRIKTAENVSKTTKAMQMIAASKLKRAQDAAVESRPFVEKISKISKELRDDLMEKEKVAELRENEMPLYMKENKNTDNEMLLVIAPDKGLCGGLVSNLAREVAKFRVEHKDAYYVTIGKKAEQIVSRVGGDMIAAFPFTTTLPEFSLVYPITRIIDEYYKEGKISKVSFLSTKFDSIFSQSPAFEHLLPIKTDEVVEKKDYIVYEPSLKEILPSLLKQYVEVAIYQTLLETYASEQAARTIAMKNATDNALEVIDELKLEYNKSRQEKITNELLDISVSAMAF